MKLKLSAKDRRRYRIMTSEIYDHKGQYIPWVIVAGAAILAAVLLFAVFPALAEGELTVTLSSGTLNVRSEPNGRIIAELYDGDEVTLISERSGWARVYCPCEAGEGYVSSAYLTDGSGEAGKYNNASDGRLRIRDKPDGKAIGWLKKGATVTVTAWRKGWAWVDSGWVDGDYLERNSENEHS